MQTRTRKIVNTIAAIIPAAMVIMSGIMKFNPPADMLAGFQKMGLLPHLPMLGIMEIGFSLLFLYRPTLRLGFMLLSCYFAGALATELSYGLPFNALLPMGLVWIGTFIRDKGLFLSFLQKPAVARA
jgi:uncharacterized membrane protein YphA (DoxX/SURF4 family)